MKIRNDEREYEGTGTEIMEQLRLETFNPNEFPDTASYIRWMRDNFVRATELDCPLPEGDSEDAVERQAMTMIVRLATAGAFLILDDEGFAEGERALFQSSYEALLRLWLQNRI